MLARAEYHIKILYKNVVNKPVKAIKQYKVAENWDIEQLNKFAGLCVTQEQRNITFFQTGLTEKKNFITILYSAAKNRSSDQNGSLCQE